MVEIPIQPSPVEQVYDAIATEIVEGKIPGKIWDEHAAILAAVTAGDGAVAERLSREHVERAAAIFVDRLRRQQEADATREQVRTRRRRLAGR